ncbi:MAG: hypothetical protein ACRDPL_16165, partial [Propionibacteriaceae bacterium]
MSIGSGSSGSGGLGAGVVERVGDLVEAVAEQVPVDVHRHRGARGTSGPRSEHPSRLDASDGRMPWTTQRKTPGLEITT